MAIAFPQGPYDQRTHDVFLFAENARGENIPVSQDAASLDPQHPNNLEIVRGLFLNDDAVCVKLVNMTMADNAWNVLHTYHRADLKSEQEQAQQEAAQ